MRDDTIAAFLDQLAARVPAPGGGATAALHAAQAAALLLIRLAEDLLPAGNHNMITDVAAAAVAVRAAAVTARLFIEVNLRGITDVALREEFAATATVADTVTARADQLVAAVREEISG